MPAERKLQAILFDMDGTIFDSEKMYCQAWVETAKHFNLHFTAQMYEQFVGMRTFECYQIAQTIFGEQFDMQPFISYFRTFISSQKAINIPIKPGFIQFFELLKQQDIKIGLVTASRQASVIENFTTLPYLKDFDLVISGDDVKQPKPDPECYLLACQQLSVTPKHTIVFEDSNTGAQAAISAGCRTIIIPDYLPIKPALAQQAEAVIDNFNQADYLLNVD